MRRAVILRCRGMCSGDLMAWVVITIAGLVLMGIYVMVTPPVIH